MSGGPTCCGCSVIARHFSHYTPTTSEVTNEVSTRFREQRECMNTVSCTCITAVVFLQCNTADSFICYSHQTGKLWLALCIAHALESWTFLDITQRNCMQECKCSSQSGWMLYGRFQPCVSRADDCPENSQ